MPSEFAIRTEPVCRIIVRGEVDAATAPQLEAAIPMSGSVWLDFSAVTFLDSSGLSCARRRARCCEGTRRPSPRIRVEPRTAARSYR